MKAILIIDMPENCGYRCPCYDEEYGICNVIGSVNGNDMPDDCPLKPLPKKKEVKPEFNNDMDLSYINGWNTCLEVLEK